MRFVIVDPKQRTIKTVDCADIIEAQDLAGLGDVDHGMIGRNPKGGIAYCIGDQSMFEPSPAQQSYCGLAGRLMAGPLVLYAFDERGETKDLRRSEVPDVQWYLGVNDVEAAIDRNEIARPIIAVNDIILWQWPQPRMGG
jgi:hypothetical protein